MLRRSNKDEAAQRATLKRRIASFYKALNEKKWQRCFEYVDPKLRSKSRVAFPTYSASLAGFFEHYGPVHPEFIKLNLYLNVATNKHDDRPFAYAIVLWQDKRHEFHVFRERWVRDDNSWYTRVAGLVTHVGAKDEASESKSVSV